MPDAADDLSPALEQSILEAEFRKLWCLFKKGMIRYYRREWNRAVRVYTEKWE